MTSKEILFLTKENFYLTSNLILTAVSGNGNSSVTAVTQYQSLGEDYGRETISLIFDNKNQTKGNQIINTEIMYNSEDSIMLLLDDLGTTALIANTKIDLNQEVDVNNLLLSSGGIEIYKYKKSWSKVKILSIKSIKEFERAKNIGYGNHVDLSSNGNYFGVVADLANTIFLYEYKKENKEGYTIYDTVEIEEGYEFSQGCFKLIDKNSFYLIRNKGEEAELVKYRRIANSNWKIDVISTHKNNFKSMDYCNLNGKILFTKDDALYSNDDECLIENNFLDCKFINKGNNIFGVSNSRNKNLVSIYDREYNEVYEKEFSINKTSIDASKLNLTLVASSLDEENSSICVKYYNLKSELKLIKEDIKEKEVFEKEKVERKEKEKERRNKSEHSFKNEVKLKKADIRDYFLTLISHQIISSYLLGEKEINTQMIMKRVLEALNLWLGNYDLIAMLKKKQGTKLNLVVSHNYYVVYEIPLIYKGIFENGKINSKLT